MILPSELELLQAIGLGITTTRHVALVVLPLDTLQLSETFEHQVRSIDVFSICACGFVSMCRWLKSKACSRRFGVCLTVCVREMAKRFAGGDAPRRHEGRKQRMTRVMRDAREERAQSEEGDRVNLFDSKVAAMLAKKWAWGQISAINVQELAFANYEDMKGALAACGQSEGFIPKSITKFASLGNWGRTPGNISRDLTSALGEPCVPEVAHVEVKVKVPKPTGGHQSQHMIKMPMILPHEMFATLYDDIDKFKNVFVGDSTDMGDSIKSFWQTVASRKDPRLQHHPMCSRPSWEKRAVPLSFHGDALPCLKVGKADSKSFEAFSWQGTMSIGSSKTTKILSFGMFDDNIIKGEDGTNKDIWEMYTWSWRVLFEGQWPHKDHKGVPYPKGSAEWKRSGKPLAGGYFGVIWLLKGDLDFFTKTLGLRHYAAHHMCDLCEANREEGSPMRWNNFRMDAPWKAALLTKSQWKLMNPNCHWLFRAFDFLSNQNVEPDILHVMHLGTTQNLLGSAMWALCFFAHAQTSSRQHGRPLGPYLGVLQG